MNNLSSANRLTAYAGVVVYLFGQAFDTYWHAKNLRFVVEPPSELWRIHAGIYLGAALVTVAGVLALRQAGQRITGGLLLAGGIIQLAGFSLDMFEHSKGISLNLWHDMLWYGFAVVVLGVVRMEATYRRTPPRVGARTDAEQAV